MLLGGGEGIIPRRRKYLILDSTVLISLKVTSMPQLVVLLLGGKRVKSSRSGKASYEKRFRH